MSFNDSAPLGSKFNPWRRLNSMSIRVLAENLRIAASMESIVRPWIAKAQKRELPEVTPPAEEFPEAFIEWGGATDFEFGDSFREKALSGLGFDVEDEEKPERVRHSFSEQGRGYRDFRVEMVDDPTQYVIVRAVYQLGLSGPNGEQWIFKLGTEYQPGIEEGSGQEPPAPPAIEDME